MAVRVLFATQTKGVNRRETPVSRNPTRVSTRGFSTTPAKTLGSAVDALSEKYDYHDCLRVVHQNVRWTYKEFKKAVDALASGLEDINYKIGNSVVSSQSNDVENVVAHVAAPRIGVKFVPITTAVSPEEIAKILDKFSPKAFIFTPKAHDIEGIKEMTGIEAWLTMNPIVSPRLPYLRHLIQTDLTPVPGMTTYSSVLLWNKRPFQVPRIVSRLNPNDGAYSFLGNNMEVRSYSQEDVLTASQAAGKQLGLTSDDRLCNTLPLNSYAASVIGLWGSYTSGTIFVVPSLAFDAEQTLKAIHDEKCTVLLGSPETIQSLLEHSGRSKYNLSTLKKVLIVHPSGASPAALGTQVQQALGVKDINYFNTQTVSFSK